jgi:hypothetical protein
MTRVRGIRTIAVTRYVTPLREGGSLPAIVEADDDGMYVLKFRGAGHGALALVAELVAGEIARATWRESQRFAVVGPPAARSESCRRGRVSAGWCRRAAQSSSRRRCTPARPVTPPLVSNT